MRSLPALFSFCYYSELIKLDHSSICLHPLVVTMFVCVRRCWLWMFALLFDIVINALRAQRTLRSRLNLVFIFIIFYKLSFRLDSVSNIACFLI